MSEGDIRAVLDRIVGPLDGELGDWNDVLARSGAPARVLDGGQARSGRRVSGSRVRRRAWHSGRSMLFFGASLVVAALVVLIAESPWRAGPSILDRAAAAVLGPNTGKILYESIAIHPNTSESPGAVIHVRVWLAGAAPRPFRVTFDVPRPTDVGGTLGGVTGLSYDPSARVLDPVAFQLPFSQSDLDPATYIRSALTSGRAQLDGRALLRGREVIRIRVSSRDAGRLVPIALYFVDARTYRPVRIAITMRRPFSGRINPLLSITHLPFGGSPGGGSWFHAVYDFREYRYLPASAANSKLTDVQAQHPHAKIV